MEFENKIPDWENVGTEPTSEIKTTGFTAGYKPPAAYFNWFFNLVLKAIKELQTKLASVKPVESIQVDAIILASGWKDGVYEWKNSNIATAEQVVELIPRSDITVEQLESLQYANIVGTNQSIGAVTFTAYGEVPAIDIPVTFIIRGDA